MVIGDFLLNQLTYQGGAGEGKINLPTHKPFFGVLNMLARSQNPLLFTRGKKEKNKKKTRRNQTTTSGRLIPQMRESGTECRIDSLPPLIALNDFTFYTPSRILKNSESVCKTRKIY